MKFIISRWKYWWQYCSIIIFAILATWLTDRARDIPAWIATICAIIFLIIFEILIRSESFIITQNSIVYSRGFFSRKDKNIPLREIVSSHLEQTNIQQLLHFGKLVVKTHSGEIVVNYLHEAQRAKHELQSLLKLH